MRQLLRLSLLIAALPVFGRHVVFVDNSRPPGGSGTAASPFSTIAAAGRAEVIYVVQTATPYVESVTLQKGQMLIGSAYGLDAIRAEMRLDDDTPAAAAQQGTGPIIRGTIAVSGDNVVAGCTVVVERSAVGVTSSGGNGPLSLRQVVFQTSQHGFAIFLQEHHGAVSIIGGGVQATGEGSGVGLTGGEGDVTVERFPISGSFATAVRISDRSVGAVTFRNGSTLRADDASDDAVVIMNMTARSLVTFSDRIQLRGRRRGFVASKVARLIVNGGDSWLATTGGTALDLADVGGEVAFDAVSAESAAVGMVADKVRGRLEIRGRNGEPGSGGTIRGARNYGIRITQSSNVRLANLAIAASGSNGTVKGAKCAGSFDVNTTVPCNAALYLRHVESSAFENILVDGGGAVGLNANNLRDVKFENVEVRGVGDETFEAGVLLQELGGNVQFIRCSFTDNAGSEVMLEQKYNGGRVSFDRCTFAAPQRPAIAPRLIDIRVLGGAQLAVDIRNAELRDNAGSAVESTVSGQASLALTVTDSTGQRLGLGGVVARAEEQGRISLKMTRVRMAAPAAPSLVDVRASGAAVLCVDLAANGFAAGGAPIRLAVRGGQATLRVVSSAGGPAALVNALAAANGGAVATIEAPAAAVSILPSCS
jgi:hypothetical protein